MLELKNIKKSYSSGLSKFYALDDVSVSFRDNEFVAILGPSGSGKTTLLNIIGGLDRYDSGDLIINSRSTKEYKDKDWDGYRNHSIGFVFQSYNLIPHQSVLSNVELALTLSGVSKKERRKRAKEVLDKVGLGDQLHKRPNQMSGGQMQRVAIARALVNDPDILLADEPTGALDSNTSEQIMELIREISKDRLVIMVTHNPELAGQYADRIIEIKDGQICKDTDPFGGEAVETPAPEKQTKPDKKKKPKTSMNFSTALLLSFNNLLTKKGRTLLTSFAGSIGIIGIALILSLSSGMQAYIDSIERDALASYPLNIQTENIDLTQLLGNISSSKADTAEHGNDKIYKRPKLENSVADFELRTQINDLGRFKTFIELNSETFAPLCSDIIYGYDIDLQVFKSDTSSGVTRLRPNDALEEIGVNSADGIWKELVGDTSLLDTQYEVLAGAWPQNYNELVLFLDKDNEIDDVTLYALGLTDVSELEAQSGAPQQGTQDAPIELEGYEYSEFLNLSFKLVSSTAYYRNDGGVWVDMSGDEAYMKKVVDSADELKIVAIARPKPGSQSTVSGGTIGYMSALTHRAMSLANDSDIVKQQKAQPNVDVFTGLAFKDSAEKGMVPTASLVSMPAVSFAAKTSDVPVVTPVTEADADVEVMTEDEIYAYIDENFEGEEKEELKEFVRLMLKDIRTVSDRKKLIAYLDKILEGSDTDSGTVYSYLQMMDKNTKLQLLSAIIIAVRSNEQVEIPDAGQIQDNTTNPGEDKTEESTSQKQESTSQKEENTAHKEENPEQKDETTEQKEEITPPEEDNKAEVEEEKEKYSDSTYEENLYLLGAADPQTPSSISIYPLNFESKEEIIKVIEEYNQKQISEGKEEYTIAYTDYVNILMSSVTQVIDIVTYALVAFVAISLVVSSIMIGIITYISVLERTKEIGILRSIGASKKDISRVFNSETIIVGLTSGMIGVLITLLLNIPINAIIKSLAGISGLSALPWLGAIALVGISVVLTLVAGFIPARVAAKKDPVAALRSE
ncbi:MAG: ABC transporter ATP-binding protein/permease [Clostridia bacterium]|nr:ABC transporter ATP-binding protein/permease [Clostridia bacterium]